MPLIPWFEFAANCTANWIPLLNAYGKYCHDALSAAGIYYIPNMGGLVTSWDTTNYGIGDGAMNEGFCRISPNNYYAARYVYAHALLWLYLPHSLNHF